MEVAKQLDSEEKGSHFRLTVAFQNIKLVSPNGGVA
jgi:hypothetical protein